MRKTARHWLILSWFLVMIAPGAGRPSEAPSGQGTAPATAEIQAPSVRPTLAQLEQATISGIYDSPITLAGGVYEGEPFAPGGGSRPRVMLWSNLVAFGALDDLPGEEAAVLLSENSGASGEFVYLAVMAVRGGQLANAGTVRVGDRVKVRAIRVSDRHVVMDVVEAGPGEPMCCPSRLARKIFAIRSGILKLVSSTVTGTLSAATLGQTEWTLVVMDGKALPAGAKPPTIRFDGLRASGFGGCNQFSGAVKEQGPGAFTFGPLAATRMACGSPQDEIENRFVALLATVSQYTFVAGRLALSGVDGGAGRPLIFEGQPAK